VKEEWAARGIITVLNTPFDAAGQVDPRALRRNVRRALDAGVVGFLAPALASEVGRLTVAERELVVRSVLEETAGAVPVIGGASAATRDERLANVRLMASLGCPGVLVAVPYESDEQYAEEVRAIDSLDPPMLMLQDWSPSGYGVPVPLIARLFDETRSFRAFKIEVVPAGVKYSEVIAATGGRLHVSGGWAVTQMIEGLDRGVHAFMPTGMHEIYCRIHALYAAGDRGGARTLFEQVLPVLAFSNQHLDISIRFFKRLLWAEGIYPTPLVREPLLPFDAAHLRIADELIERARRITRGLGAR
jgi:dihydrodipicolinate synthase/N-acetylneuraminate lyase